MGTAAPTETYPVSVDHLAQFGVRAGELFVRRASGQITGAMPHLTPQASIAPGGEVRPQRRAKHRHRVCLGHVGAARPFFSLESASSPWLLQTENLKKPISLSLSMSIYIYVYMCVQIHLGKTCPL